MSDFILYYDRLEAVANHSKSLGKRADEYAADLERKIISGIGTVTGPSSGYLLSASDSVRDKITALKQKSQAFYQFAEQIMKLLEVAEQMDQEVADAITGRRGELEHRKSLGLEDWKAKLIELLVDIKNGSPALSTIADLLGGMAAIHESLEDSIKHWYETEAGKRKGKGAAGKIETHNNIAGVAATGVGVASLFHGKEFDLFKNGPLSFSNLNNWKGNGKVELKDNNKKIHSNDSVADGLGNTVAGFRQLEMQDNRSVSEPEVIFIAKMESVGMTFDEAYDLTVALRVNKGILTKKQYRDFGFADEFGMAYAELQYKLVQEGMTVEQIDYLNSSERLAQAVTMSIGMLVTAGVSIRGSGSIARSAKKTSNVPKGAGNGGSKMSLLDDPKIAKDVVADPDAIYGYRPKQGSSLDQFDIDWSNADEVAKAKAARLEYLEAMEAKKAKLSAEVDNYLTEGKNMREIAEMKVNQRNMDRINSYIERGDYDNLEKLYERNLLEYGQKEGPTVQQLYEKCGSYEDVIYSSVNVNKGMNVILGIDN